MPADFFNIQKTMKQAILLVLLLLNVIITYSQIANDTVDLSEFEVVSSANPVKFNNISRTLHIITRDEISSAPVSSIDELLKIYGGIDIRTRGSMGVQSDISFRGGSFDQGLVMVNGISLNDPQTGHHNLSQTIDIEDVDKIEIFEGPGTRWFGANSFSGGINIISNKPSTRSISLSLKGGQHGYINGKVKGSYKLGNIINSTSAGIKRSGGYITNTDFNIININHSSHYNTRNGDIAINLGLLDKGFGANSFYTPKYPNQYEHIRTYFTSVAFETGLKVKFSTVAFWRRNNDRFELFREDKNWYVKQNEVYINQADTAGFPAPNGLYPYKGHNYHRTDIIGVDAAIRFNSFMGNTSISLGLKSESIVSNVLGEPMPDTVFIAGTDGYYDKSKRRNNANISINQFYSFNNISVSAGLSLFHNNEFGTHISPGIDIGYFINEYLKIFANANQAIRLPTFTDLYYQGPTNISNPNLKPESSISTEVGIKFFNNHFNASISGYYRMGSNIIDWIKYSPEEKWQSANLSKLNTYGFSLSANKRFSKGVFNYAGIKYSWLNSEKDNTDIISLYAMDFLTHNLNLFLSHDIIEKLSTTWTTTIQKRNGSYIDYGTGRETQYATVVLLNVKLLYQLNNFEFSVSGSNLLNKKYYDIGNIQQPGLWIIGGVKIKISK